MSVAFPWNTIWKGDNIELYLRKKVNIPVLEAGDALQFTMFYDEDFEFYINGVLAYAATGWSTNYVNFDIYPEAKAAIIMVEKLVCNSCCPEYWWLVHGFGCNGKFPV
jgi:hypothetical protein